MRITLSELEEAVAYAKKKGVTELEFREMADDGLLGWLRQIRMTVAAEIALRNIGNYADDDPNKGEKNEIRIQDPADRSAVLQVRQRQAPVCSLHAAGDQGARSRSRCACSAHGPVVAATHDEPPAPASLVDAIRAKHGAAPIPMTPSYQGPGAPTVAAAAEAIAPPPSLHDAIVAARKAGRR